MVCKSKTTKALQGLIFLSKYSFFNQKQTKHHEKFQTLPDYIGSALC